MAAPAEIRGRAANIGAAAPECSRAGDFGGEPAGSRLVSWTSCKGLIRNEPHEKVLSTKVLPVPATAVTKVALVRMSTPEEAQKVIVGESRPIKIGAFFISAFPSPAAGSTLRESERGRTVPLPDGPQLRVPPERTVPGQAPERTVPGKGSLYLKSKTKVQSFQVQSARGPIVHGHCFFPIKSKPPQLPERTVPGDVSLSGS